MRAYERRSAILPLYACFCRNSGLKAFAALDLRRSSKRLETTGDLVLCGYYVYLKLFIATTHTMRRCMACVRSLTTRSREKARLPRPRTAPAVRRAQMNARAGQIAVMITAKQSIQKSADMPTHELQRRCTKEKRCLRRGHNFTVT